MFKEQDNMTTPCKFHTTSNTRYIRPRKQLYPFAHVQWLEVLKLTLSLAKIAVCVTTPSGTGRERIWLKEPRWYTQGDIDPPHTWIDRKQAEIIFILYYYILRQAFPLSSF